MLRGFVELSLALASQGLHVLPVSRTKVPVIRSPHPRGHRCRGECGQQGHGVWDATTDPDTIRGWGSIRGAQPAVACGPSGLIVLDVDGPAGESTLAALGPVPATLEVSTGRPDGGRHLWYATDLHGLHPRRFPGIDVKAGPSYVVAPGAVHRTGAVYRVSRDLPIAPAPSWLVAFCAISRAA